jgi:hypothetical protein
LGNLAKVKHLSELFQYFGPVIWWLYSAY